MKHSKRLIGLTAAASLALMSFVVYDQYSLSAANIFDNLTESPSDEQSSNTPLSVSSVVTAAQAFKATLSSSQITTLQQNYSATLARKWSNLPCGSGCRNGIQFSTLTTAQLNAALAVIEQALGTTSNNGYDEFLQIRTAEDWLGANGGGSGYASGLRWIAFLNEPSETGAWMLQFGGHHYAANISFKDGHVIGTTPFFVALEPATFTYNGTTYAPMEDEKTALQSMLASLSSTQLAAAKLTTTFSDCLMSPGESNGNTNTFPATKQGLAVSGLSATQKDLVLAAIRNYVEDVDAATAAVIMDRYTDEIDQTYIAFTGNGTAGTASSFLNANTNYVRIDGPTVWIEFACQNGVVVQNQIHYHSVWRDHASDYGVDLNGTAIDEPLAVADVSAAKEVSIYPNPATDKIIIESAVNLSKATASIIDMTGKVISTTVIGGQHTEIIISQLPQGNYILRLANKEGKVYHTRFIKK